MIDLTRFVPTRQSLLPLVAVAATAAAAGAMLLTASGCNGPVYTRSEAELREALTQALADQIADNPGYDITLTRPESGLADQFSQERLDQLEEMGGPAGYPDAPLEIESLSGLPTETVRVSLQEAILTAVEHNFDVQIAGIQQAIADAEVTGAEAAFDAVWFTTIDWQHTDTPQVRPIISGTSLAASVNAGQQTVFTTGVRKDLITGGNIEISTTLDRRDNDSLDQQVFPDPAYASSIDLGITQPLLRGFGSDVALAQVRLRRNAQRTEAEAFRDSLIQTVTQVEAAYWNLVLARQAVRIRERLLERGRETEQKLRNRASFDAEKTQISDAISRVQNREIAVQRARNEVLLASDRLKSLMNAPGYSVGGQVMIVPTDDVVTDPVSFNLVDAIMTAAQRRPEIRRALLLIDDASIRQMLADNLRLPLLNASGLLRGNGLNNSAGGSFDNMRDEQFLSYFLSLNIEVPIGNREAQSIYRAARLRRMQAVVGYQSVLQSVTRQVVESLRNIKLNYDLLTATKDARVAAAEALRTITVKEEIQAATTPEFLNLKFSRQETLAQAEIDEIRALIDYQISLSNLYSAMGVILERNQIEVVAPEFED